MQAPEDHEELSNWSLSNVQLREISPLQAVELSQYMQAKTA